MNNQEQESVTNSKASYSSDLNSSNNNSLEDSDETDDYEDNSNSISNPKVYLITIQIYPDEQQAILSIGIKNAPPIIKNASYQEITQQTIIQESIQELEVALPKIIEAAEKRKIAINHINQSQERKQVQKRELSNNSHPTESDKQQLSLF